MKTSLRLALALVALLVLAAAPGAFAQAPRPTGSSQGSVQNGVYTWPQAGFSLSLPPLWLRSGYKWYENWGPNANGITGAQYINEWVYTPVTPGASAVAPPQTSPIERIGVIASETSYCPIAAP